MDDLQGLLLPIFITTKKVCAHDENCLRSRWKLLALTIKKACARDKKGRRWEMPAANSVEQTGNKRLRRLAGNRGGVVWSLVNCVGRRHFRLLAADDVIWSLLCQEYLLYIIFIRFLKGEYALICIENLRLVREIFKLQNSGICLQRVRKRMTRSSVEIKRRKGLNRWC